jgi:hypothetical protein
LLCASAESLPGKSIGAVAPVLAGHLVDEAAGRVCGHCGARIAAAA